ncbi:putative protein FAM10A4 [Leptopilina heterotoma]|uniref:putative protein FAM10A4 n=1 Tax=Leptopilina heterotoma TaxID=63436 RepID=UPI001CA9459F|nr:putative protein FAM10A4 [Leptopilina heterotoma]
MSHPFKKEQLIELKFFTEMCIKDPEVLNLPELSFMKDFVKHFGGTVPKSRKNEKKPEEFKASEPVVESEPETEDSDIELDMTGVIEPDTDAPQKMGDPTAVPTEEEISESKEKWPEAVSAYAEKDFEKAIQLYTEAIILNPQKALLFAKRGQVYLNLNKPNACIRDCNRALELNPDSPAAHRFRGRAYQLLGKWEEAASDLRFACQVDFDELAQEWLKEVTPNARKLEEHRRKKERKASEKKDRERQERLKKAQEACSKARDDNTRTPQTNSDGDFYQFLNDPDVLQSFQDPEVAEAFKDISSNPANMFKYQNNPKIMSLITKVASKFGGAGGMGGMGGFPGMMGGMPGFPGAGATPPKPSAPNDDVGLD